MDWYNVRKELKTLLDEASEREDYEAVRRIINITTEIEAKNGPDYDEMQERYKSKMNEELSGMCTQMDSGDYYQAYSTYMKNVYIYEMMRSLRFWSAIGAFAGLLWRDLTPLLVVITLLAAIFFSTIYYTGTGPLLLRRDSFIRWYANSGIVAHTLFYLLYAVVCAAVIFVVLTITR